MATTLTSEDIWGKAAAVVKAPPKPKQAVLSNEDIWGAPAENAPAQSEPKFDPQTLLPNTLSVGPYDTGINISPKVSSFLVGAGRGIESVGQGAKQLYLHAINSPEAGSYDQQVKEDASRFAPLEKQSGYASAGNVVGSVAATAPTMLIPGATAATWTPRLLNAAAQGAITGLLNPATSDNYQAQKAGDVVSGGLLGAGASGVLGGAGKLVNAAAGKYVTPTIQNLQDLAKQYNIPLSVGDLSQNPMLRKGETFLENIWGSGMPGFRKEQGQAAQNAAQDITNSVATPSTVVNTGGRVEPTLGSRPLISNYEQQLNDSLQRVLAQRKAASKAEINDITTQASKLGVDNQIVPTELKGAAQDLISNFSDIFKSHPNAQVQSKLNTLVGNLTETNQPRILLANGQAQPVTTSTKGLTFDEAKTLLEDISAYKRQLQRAQGQGAVNDKATAAVMNAESALKNDIANWGENLNDNLAQRYSNWRKNYFDTIVPFKDRQLGSAAGADANLEKIISTFVKPDNQQLASKLTANLDDTGRAALQYGVLREAYDRALDTNTGVFSPLKFRNEIQNLGTTNNVVFSPEKVAQLDGLSKLMTAAAKGGQFLGEPKTGMSLMMPGAMAGMAGTGAALGAYSGLDPLTTGAAGLAIGAGGARALTGLLTSEFGKRILLSASKVDVDSPVMQKLLNQVYLQVPKAVVAGKQSQK